MTVQTDSELANFQQAKSLLFKWNLQFDRAEKYLRQFALVILAFSLTACALVIRQVFFTCVKLDVKLIVQHKKCSNPGFEENYGFPALITLGIYFVVFLFGFSCQVNLLFAVCWTALTI